MSIFGSGMAPVRQPGMAPYEFTHGSTRALAKLRYGAGHVKANYAQEGASYLRLPLEPGNREEPSTDRTFPDLSKGLPLLGNGPPHCGPRQGHVYVDRLQRPLCLLGTSATLGGRGQRMPGER